jgi:hypothetical protein
MKFRNTFCCIFIIFIAASRSIRVTKFGQSSGKTTLAVLSVLSFLSGHKIYHPPCECLLTQGHFGLLLQTFFGMKLLDFQYKYDCYINTCIAVLTGTAVVV